MRRLLRSGSVALLLAAAIGCATGRALSKAEDAKKKGDWDAAVAYYLEALGRDPKRVETKIALREATHAAAGAHLDRARKLEAQDQLSGAAAEYKQAADLDPANTLAASKALELERVIRDRIEASRPKSKMDELRAQATYEPPVLDPRVTIPLLQFAQGTAVRDILGAISSITGINITYDQGTAPIETYLGRPTTGVALKDVRLDVALNQILSANQLFYKVIDPKTILVAVDTPQVRQALEDQAVQTFYISNWDASEMAAMLQGQLGQLQLAIRPQFLPNKTANTITVRASLPTLDVIGKIIRANDKPRAEIIVDIEILEVDRTRIQDMGINLSAYALGLTFSPEVAPPNAAGSLSAPPASPPPINLNNLTRGVNTTDFYLTVPTALLKMMESDTHTRILAHPQLRGQEGQALSMKLGDQIPVAATTFSALAAGGANTLPSVSYQYKDVGVNVTLTNPKVTYDNEIILQIEVVNSAVGGDVIVAGSSLPSFTNRQVDTFLRLRDGESNLIAGLLREQDRKTISGFPGVSQIPLLRALFGESSHQIDQTDIVMVITPRIIRTHEITADDMKPIYVGTQRNFGLVGPPPLIAPPDSPPVANPSQPAVPTASAASTAQPSVPPAASSRIPGVVPVAPVPQPPAPAAPPGAPARVTLTPPGTVFDMAGGVRPVPIQITGVSQLGSITLTVTYDPKVLKAQAALEGTAMKQGNVTTTFTPKIDEATGRVDIVITRTGGAAGLSVPADAAGLLAAINFVPVAPGASPITLSGLAMSASGQPIALQFVSSSVTVK
jgi:type II secretory pathway component HofQ